MFDFKSVPIPDYSRKEDWVNSITHMIGVPFAVFALVMCITRCVKLAHIGFIPSVIVYGITMIILYASSATYHGFNPSFPKRVLRVVDHSVIFLLIAGTVTPFSLVAIKAVNLKMGIAICASEWILAALGILFTFMNQEKFKVIQMIMYIAMGWAVVIGFACVYKFSELGKMSVIFILGGGIAYTVGAILYGVGKKVKYIHSVFHVFILAGSVLQFVGIYKYMLAM